MTDEEMEQLAQAQTRTDERLGYGDLVGKLQVASDGHTQRNAADPNAGTASSSSRHFA